MSRLEEFIAKLSVLEASLEALEIDFKDLSNDYHDLEFDKKNRIAGRVDALLQLLTHETSSSLLLGMGSLIELDKYVAFRKKYAMLSDRELEDLIDTVPKTLDKLALQRAGKRIDVKTLRSEWNAVFPGKSFKKTIMKLEAG